MTTDLKLEINPATSIDVVAITPDLNCAVVDDFLLNPDQLVAYAKALENEFIAPERAYPGLLLPVSNPQVSALNSFIKLELGKLFSFCRGGIDFYTQFSITTRQPEDFSWIQRLCHTDPKLADGRKNYAALLYLFDQPALGGTGFYRWKNEKYFAAMSAKQRDNPAGGLEELKEKFQMFREAPRYMTESNEVADLIDMVPARFNRLVFYSGDLPHSAYIENPELLSADPSSGRLTLNCFASVIPKT